MWMIIGQINFMSSRKQSGTKEKHLMVEDQCKKNYGNLSI